MLNLVIYLDEEISTVPNIIYNAIMQGAVWSPPNYFCTTWKDQLDHARRACIPAPVSQASCIHTHTPILFEQTRLLVWPDLIYSIKSCQNEPILTETTGADQYTRVHLQMTCWLCECIAFSGAEWSWPRSATKGSSGANNYYQVYNGSSAYVCASNLILLWIRHRNVLVVASGARFAYMN